MRNWIVGALIFVAAETVAIACSCMAPGSPEQSRPAAREAVRNASAIVEVDVLSGYDQQYRRGERVTVRRTLFGRAPARFEVYRLNSPSSASCDIELTRGERRILILYPAPRRMWGQTRYRIQSLCSDYLTERSRYLPVTLQEARRRR